MIIQVTDHPLVLLGELEVSLPGTVAMRPLESALTPDLSRLGDGVVESSRVEDIVDGCVAVSALLRVIAEVSFDAAWSPIPCPSELKDELYCLLWGSMDRVGFVGLNL